MKKTQISGKILSAHGLEELILLKRPYHPKQSTDSMQSLSKFQSHFSQGTNNPKICVEPQKTPNSQRNLEKEEQN